MKSELLHLYNTEDYEEGVGTFRKNKLKDKKIQIKKGYHLNVYTYELEEVYNNDTTTR